MLPIRLAIAVVLLPAVLPAADVETKPFGGERAVIPGKIEAEHYDLGQAEVAYHDIDQPNRGADYREETQVDIEKRDDASNGHGVGWTKAGEWLLYSVRIEKTGKYTLTIPVASNKQGGKFHLEINGKDITGAMEVPDTGGWNKLKTIQRKDISLPKGDHRIKMVMDKVGASQSIGDIDCLIFKFQNGSE